MRSFSRRVWTWLACGLGLAVGGAPGGASALGITLPLTVEFDDGLTGSYGTVRIDEIAGADLEFRITLGSSLGPSADLHQLYFNLENGINTRGLAVSGFECDGGSCHTPFGLDSGRPVAGGAGSRFDYRVSFGNGAGTKGNGTLEIARFVLGADAALGLAAVFAEASSTSGGIRALFAAHVQGTNLVRGANSETLGVVPVPIPEPATAALFGIGLAGLTLASRRQGS